MDLAEDSNSIKLIEAILAAGKSAAQVCHAPGALRHVNAPNGRPVVEGKKVTDFPNGEEAAVGLTEVVPFLVKDELKAKGAHVVAFDVLRRSELKRFWVGPKERRVA